IPGPITQPYFNTIREASYGYKKGVKVQLDGIGRFNRSERLQKIVSVEHVTLLDPLDFQAQLDDLRTLRDGWLDGNGYAPTTDGLDWLAEAFEDHYSDNLRPPYVYPVPEGGVRLEWSIAPQDVSLEINLRERSGEWHSLNLETDEEEVQLLNLDNKGD